MSVKHSLLAILDQGPCYGYQLRHEFDRRTGSIWPLNVGQVYNTLERLERDGLVAHGETDAQGHVFFEITPAGRDVVRSWLDSPVERGSGTRDESAIKLALAATLPGVDVGAVIRTQREAALARQRELHAAQGAESPTDAQGLARSLVLDAMLESAAAEVRWLDRAHARLAQHPDHAMALELSTERPRRGRPTLPQPAAPAR